MPSPINNLGASFATQAASGKPTAKAADKGAPNTPPSETSGSDIGALRQTAMASTSDFDREKVESIKQAIAEGRFQVNPERIAEVDPSK